MTARTYTSPEAFKQALEQRLRSVAKSGDAFARNRQLLVFDRFLARIVAVFGTAPARIAPRPRFAGHGRCAGRRMSCSRRISMTLGYL